MNDLLGFNHTALADLISRHWQEERSYFTLNRKARGAWLEASWWRQPANNALKLHRCRRPPAFQMQTVFATSYKEPGRGHPA